MPACKAAEIAKVANVDLNTTDPSRSVAHVLGIGKSSVNQHRAGKCSCAHDDAPEIHKDSQREHCDVGPDGGEFTGIKTDKPLTDWTHIFEKFGLSPNDFEIEGDTVRCSMWNQSAAHNGARDIVTMYAYRAKFRRKTKENAARLDDLITNIRTWSPRWPNPQVNAEPVTLVVGLADWQLGKSESGVGTPQTIERLRSCLDGTRAYIEARVAEGKNIERIVLANMGDHIESTHGSYASQAGSVDLNLRDQLSLALELNMQWIKAMREYAPVTYTVALCNHGVFSRVGHDSVTGDADNAGGFIGDQLRTVCKYNEHLADVEFVVPRDEMITTYTTSGVNLAMAHGHKIAGNEGTWLASQSTALAHRQRFIPDLWLTAHKHHAEHKDFGPYSRIQCTTVDPGSKWFLDAKGQYSTPGTTVFLTGEHLPMKWDDYKVIV